MKHLMKKIYHTNRALFSIYYCLLSGIRYRPTFNIKGKIFIKRGFFFQKSGKLTIGDYFIANSTLSSNSIGIIQPIVINITNPNSIVKIGDNVGISGSTINSTNSITIGNNVLIGSGCLISDTDSHPINYTQRDDHTKTISKPIVIGDDVFIGARSIILKGVKIGKGSIIGAGSVVTKSFPELSVIAGNPARQISEIKI